MAAKPTALTRSPINSAVATAVIIGAAPRMIG